MDNLDLQNSSAYSATHQHALSLEKSGSLLSNKYQDPYWTLVNLQDCFKIMTETVGGYPFISQKTDDGNEKSKVLIIDKKTVDVIEKDYEYSDQLQSSRPVYFCGIIGIINIMDYNFLAVITEKEYAGQINGQTIYLIKTTLMIPFSENIYPSQQCKRQKLNNLIDGVKKLLTTGFYFSYYADITQNRKHVIKKCNFQDFKAADQTPDKEIQKVENGDSRYIWNHQICLDFTYHHVDSRWTVNLIQGYVGYHKYTYEGASIETLLISRRMHAQSGIKSYTTGLDDEGNCANYVETEVILTCNNSQYSFVQSRGTVPIFWQFKQTKSKIVFSRDRGSTLYPLMTHISKILDNYNKLIFLNLLSRNETWESNLKAEYQEMFQIVQDDRIRNVNYEFNAEVQNDFRKLNKIIESLDQQGNYQIDFSLIDLQENLILMEQKGLIRTQCVDSSDRSNIAQYKIALTALHIIQEQLQQNASFMQLFTEQSGIYQSFIRLWQENGKQLSLQYQLKKPLIRLIQKQVKKSGIMSSLTKMKKGVKTYFNNATQERLIHESIKVLTYRHPCQKIYGIRERLQKILNRNHEKYSQQKNLKILLFTWNCAGEAPSHELNLNNIILPEDREALPDLIVIGLQEIVKLNAKSVFKGKNKERNQMWIDMISQHLQKSANYVCLQTRAMVGCFILLFSKQDLKNCFSNIRTSKVKTGFGGNGGNKGCVSIRFDLHDSSFVFMNCHLASHQSKVQERLDDLKNIKSKLYDNSDKYHDFSLKKHDYNFLLGDLNFRIDLPKEVAEQHIEQCDFASLWCNDQLLICKQIDPILMNYSEGELNFNPSYKYDKGSNQYDTSKKQRAPAWCDRILYRKPQNPQSFLQLLHYGRKESLFSDHRPVFAIFKCSVIIVDKVKRSEIEQELLKDISQSNKYLIEKQRISAIQLQSPNKQELQTEEQKQTDLFTGLQQDQFNNQGYFSFDTNKNVSSDDTSVIDDLLKTNASNTQDIFQQLNLNKNASVTPNAEDFFSFDTNKQGSQPANAFDGFDDFQTNNYKNISQSYIPSIINKDIAQDNQNDTNDLDIMSYVRSNPSNSMKTQMPMKNRVQNNQEDVCVSQLLDQDKKFIPRRSNVVFLKHGDGTLQKDFAELINNYIEEKDESVEGQNNSNEDSQSNDSDNNEDKIKEKSKNQKDEDDHFKFD
eukprot:403331952